MVDLATKYCQGAWISNKSSQQVANKFIEKWVSIFGAPSQILTDNGGEF